MKVLRYAVIALAIIPSLTAQTVQVSITLKPEWHKSFEKGIANLNQQRARLGKPSQTKDEFIEEAMSKVIFNIVVNMNEPADTPAEIRQADATIANAQRAKQDLWEMMAVRDVPDPAAPEAVEDQPVGSPPEGADGESPGPETVP